MVQLEERPIVRPTNLSQEQQAAHDRIVEAIIDGVDPDRADVEASGLLAWHEQHDQAEPFRWWRASEAGRPWEVAGAVPTEDDLVDALRRRWAFTYSARCRAAERLPVATAEAAELQAKIKELVHRDWAATRLDELQTIGDLIVALRRAQEPVGPSDEAVAPLNLALRRANGEATDCRQVLSSSRSWVLLDHVSKLERLQAAAVDAGDGRRAAEIGEELEQASAMLAEPASFSLYVKPQPALASSSSTPRG